MVSNLKISLQNVLRLNRTWWMSLFYRFGGVPRSSFYIACEPTHLDENWGKYKGRKRRGEEGKWFLFSRIWAGSQATFYRSRGGLRSSFCRFGGGLRSLFYWIWVWSTNLRGVWGLRFIDLEGVWGLCFIDLEGSEVICFIDLEGFWGLRFIDWMGSEVFGHKSLF